MGVLKEFSHNRWTDKFTTTFQHEATQFLESGHILFFPQLKFSLNPEEKKFLSPKFVNVKYKNISLHPEKNTLSHVEANSNDLVVLKSMLKRFSHATTQLVKSLFDSYGSFLIQGRTSFRPVEILGRKTSYRKDDTRLHVDAFPATPLQGKRILRVFSNINPNKDRVWRTGESFDAVVSNFIAKVPKYSSFNASILEKIKLTKSFRSEYDHIMLNIHNMMKKDLEYQKYVDQTQVAFPPHSSWIVQTDHVSHAAMSGQFVLEQTFYLPVEKMVNPALSPLRVLEKKWGKKLVR